MGLLETLVLGAYVYTTLLAGWFYRRLDRLFGNHLKHLTRRVTILEELLKSMPK